MTGIKRPGRGKFADSDVLRPFARAKGDEASCEKCGERLSTERRLRYAALCASCEWTPVYPGRTAQPRLEDL